MEILPLAIPTDDERSRKQLFLAFKAASIVVDKIQADASNLVDIQKTLPEIPLEFRELPSVSKIGSVEFTLLGRHDSQISYRNLAMLTPTREPIYVKFTQRYSQGLHEVCQRKGLAPRLLGFDRLPGGWYALAMDMFDFVAPARLKSFSKLDTWKQKIQKLVQDFHEQGLVHGDLRLPNFLFTRGSPTKVFLIDLDWGGKEGEVDFLRGKLADGLRGEGDQYDRLDQPITREDDDRVLKMTFEELDSLAANLQT